MLKDQCFVTSQPQPLIALSWQAAAARFFSTRGEFLKLVPNVQNPVGLWYTTCFPFKGFTDRPLIRAEVLHMRRRFQSFYTLTLRSRYETVKRLEQLFKEQLEYPPYDLSDNWDGNAPSRRAWAEEQFRLGRTPSST